MFNINDYLITTTSTRGGLDTNPTIDVEVTIDKEKIKEDIELFKIILESLEKLIGPYTIKVDSQKTKIKKKKRSKEKNNTMA